MAEHALDALDCGNSFCSGAIELRQKNADKVPVVVLHPEGSQRKQLRLLFPRKMTGQQLVNYVRKELQKHGPAPEAGLELYLVTGKPVPIPMSVMELDDRFCAPDGFLYIHCGQAAAKAKTGCERSCRLSDGRGGTEVVAQPPLETSIDASWTCTAQVANQTLGKPEALADAEPGVLEDPDFDTLHLEALWERRLMQEQLLQQAEDRAREAEAVADKMAESLASVREKAAEKQESRQKTHDAAEAETRRSSELLRKIHDNVSLSKTIQDGKAMKSSRAELAEEKLQQLGDDLVAQEEEIKRLQDKIHAARCSLKAEKRNALQATAILKLRSIAPSQATPMRVDSRKLNAKTHDAQQREHCVNAAISRLEDVAEGLQQRLKVAEQTLQAHSSTAVADAEDDFVLVDKKTLLNMAA